MSPRDLVTIFWQINSFGSEELYKSLSLSTEDLVRQNLIVNQITTSHSTLDTQYITLSIFSKSKVW